MVYEFDAIKSLNLIIWLVKVRRRFWTKIKCALVVQIGRLGQSLCAYFWGNSDSLAAMVEMGIVIE